MLINDGSLMMVSTLRRSWRFSVKRRKFYTHTSVLLFVRRVFYSRDRAATCQWS
jgi:hypothetical protein